MNDNRIDTMTGKKKDSKDIDGAQGAATGPGGISADGAAKLQRGLPVTIHGQYVKDISFENPNAPESLWADLGQPAMDINFSMGAKRIEMESGKVMFEVTLGVTATAKRGDMVGYIAEVEYAVLASLNGVPESHQHPTLLIKIPEFAFPFVRQIIADITQQGGYMPLLLAPVDFRAMYIDRFGDKDLPQKEAAAKAG
jgi:preprotein translocase subunit SecB